MSPRRRFSLVRVLCAAILIAGGAAAGRGVFAQGSGPIPLAANQPTFVTLAPGQTVSLTFPVVAGDVFEVSLSRLAEITYSAVLIDPDQNATALLPGANGNVSYTVDGAPRSGTYTLMIQATAGSGDMLVQVNSSSVPPVDLAAGQTPVTLAGEVLRFNLLPPADAAGAMRLTLDAIPLADAPQTAGLPALRLVRQDTGTAVLDLAAGVMPQAALLLPAQPPFLLVLRPGGGAPQVVITWETVGAAAPLPTEAVAPPTPSLPPAAQVGVCQVSVISPVNLRSGPGTAYEPPLALASAGDVLTMTARNPAGDWFQVIYNDQPAWVYSQYVQIVNPNDCTTIPALDVPPPAGTAPADQGAIPAATPAPVEGAPEAGMEAPPDANYSLSIPLDASAAASDVVSYPGGDTEDRVFYEVTGLEAGVRAALTITATCAGAGSENLVFFSGGQSFACEQTIVSREITGDSSTGSIVITAAGGEGTAVQWTLNGTASRLQ